MVIDKRINEDDFISGLKNWDNISDLEHVAEITKTAIEVLSQSDNFKVVSSGIIVNTWAKSCKWYCMSTLNIPIVCSKFDNCNNFSRASSINTQLDFKNHQQNISDIY